MSYANSEASRQVYHADTAAKIGTAERHAIRIHTAQKTFPQHRDIEIEWS